MTNKKQLKTGIVVVVAAVLVLMAVPVIAADDGASSEGDIDNETVADPVEEDSGSSTDAAEDGSSADSTEDDGESSTDAAEDENSQEVCEGAPRMSRTSIVSPQNKITPETPGVVEASFRPDPTLPEECTIIADLEFSFSGSGFQFGGGANWDQSTTDLAVTQFEVDPGEVRDIRGEIHTNGAEVGDEVTVIADYELWYEGDRDNSVQQSGIRHTIDVEGENPPPEPTDSDGSSDDGTADGDGESDDGGDEPTGGWLEFLQENLSTLGVILLGLIAVVGLVKRKPIVNIFKE